MSNQVTHHVPTGGVGRGKVGVSAPSKEDIITTIEQFEGKTGNGHIQSFAHAEESSEPEFPIGASFTHSYSTEWEKLFTGPVNYLRNLRVHGLRGQLRSSRFRSVCWKLFLEVLPDEFSQWAPRTREWREKYEELLKKLITNPRKAVDSVDLSLNNPLSQENESPWNQFFQDNELRLTIKQDVIRTFPEIEYFRSLEVQELLANVLFMFCREHYYSTYRQGMHELLAPIVFVLHCDHQAYLHASELETLPEIIGEVMDPAYLEHDAYSLFCQVMETVEPWYTCKDLPMQRSQEFSVTQPFARPPDLNSSSVITTKLTRIHDYILKKYDTELQMHLERLEIYPQIYGIRWIRLLFGREFPMQDLLVVWDAIFTDGIGFELVDYLFVAMLLYLRDLLLSSDYPSCLSTLMRYPPVGDIQYFVDKALYLREPNQYQRPPNYTFRLSQGTGKSKGRSRVSAIVEQPRKRGSSASLSQVEDSMFRSVPSASSFASTQSSVSPAGTAGTPDDELYHSSPTKYSTLPNRARQKGARKMTKMEQDLNLQIGRQQGEVNEHHSMCRYCASKLDIHIERLQAQLLSQRLRNEDDVLVAIAGIKQVRDVLKGTLRFSQNLLDEDPISINENYYKEEASATYVESGTSATERKPVHPKRIFYMSSEENSENVESPMDPLESAQGYVDVELEDYHSNKTQNIPAEAMQLESGFSGDSRLAGKEEGCETTPNPLYQYDMDETIR